jgi:hypothetical protein
MAAFAEMTRGILVSESNKNLESFKKLNLHLFFITL